MLKDTIDKNANIKVNSKSIEMLKRDFPQCFDKDGKFDIQTFESLIKAEEVDIKKEGYSLDFLGKSYARYLASLDSETVIVPDADNKNIDSQNIYIVGDNLDALQHLKYSYSGQIKCIYIDPPYNTGTDGFVYNDKFEFTAEELAKKINIEEDEARRVLDMQGKSTHSAWLTFMYPRLELARDLLAEDGVIFISIDDNEQANCKLLCDMIFGEGNFVGELIWQSATDNNPRQISTEHEYIICYGKNSDKLPKWAVNSKKAQLIQNHFDELKAKSTDIIWLQKELRKWIKDNIQELQGVSHYNNVDERGVYSNSSNSSNTKPGGYMFDIIHPLTGKPCVKPAFGWRWTETTFWAYDKEGNVDWGIDETTQPHIKKRLETVQEQLKSIYYEDGRVATKQIEKLFGNKKIFDNPKPISLIKRLINFATDEDALILDFFSGSSTTAHAIFDQNIITKDSRKFILVQLNEPVKKGSEAEKAGYKTIDEIGRERIRRAAKKLSEDYPERTKDVDLGFKTYYLKTTDKNTLDKIINFNPALPIDGEDIKSKFGTETVLETWKIKDGYGFNTNVQAIDLCGYTAHLLLDSKVGASLYLIEDMPDKAIIELVRKIEAHELNLDRIIEYGYAFGYTTNMALRSNLKTLKNRTSIEPIMRY